MRKPINPRPVLGPKSVPVKFPQGIALLSIAETYPTLKQVLLEQIQNALDAKAQRVKVVLDLQKRTSAVYDDGTGASEAKFNSALLSVLRTIKNPDELGRWGRGLISGLGKCERFTFTACEAGKEDRGFNLWTFVTDEISQMDDGVSIPLVSDKTIVYMPGVRHHEVEQMQRQKGLSPVWWRARMVFSKIVHDRTVTRIDFNDLAESILGNFGKVMLKNEVVLSLRHIDSDGVVQGDRDIVAKPFHGKQLEPFAAYDPSAGKVKFNLFLARLAGGARRGKIYFAEEGSQFRLEPKEFVHCAGDLLDADARDAVISGFFEGEITAEKIELKPNREEFAMNDALVGFCDQINKWYKAIGEEHFAEDLDLKKASLYQRAGLAAMEELQNILKLPGYSDVLQHFKLGSIGVHHKEVKPVAEDDTTTISTDGRPIESRGEKTPGGNGSPFVPPEVEHKGHSPGVVQGPRGRKRIIVRGGSVGMTFKYEEMQTTLEVFNFSSASGTVVFNTRNPLFCSCANSAYYLSQYQLAVATMAITLFRHEGKPTYEAQRQVMLEYLDLQVHSILESTSLIRRLRALKSTKK